MAIIVEDGSIVEDANSYISEDDLIDYALDRGIVIEPVDAPVIIHKGMDYIESKDYKGELSSNTQELQHPRKNMYVRGKLIDDDVIHPYVVKSLAETCLAIHDGINPLAPVGRKLKSQTLGPLSRTFADDAEDTPQLLAVNKYLRHLLKEGEGLHYNLVGGSCI
jgi:hypothetical protein